MSLNLSKWKERRKELGWTYEMLANKAQVSLNTIKNIFREETTDPRLDTVQAIERALGLAPTFTEEERALGLSENHLIALSDDDRELIHLFAEAEDELGKAYVKAVKQMVRLQIDSKDKP